MSINESLKMQQTNLMSNFKYKQKFVALAMSLLPQIGQVVRDSTFRTHLRGKPDVCVVFVRFIRERKKEK